MIFWQLFITFLKVGTLGFGGGYAMLSFIQFEVVEKQAWMDAAQFTDIIAVSQAVPGPIAFNSATYIGYAVTGSIWGSALAAIAICLPALVFMLIICRFFLLFRKNVYVQELLRWIKPVCIGLIGAAAIMLMTPYNFADLTSIIIFAVVLLLQLCFRRLNPILLILAAGLAGYFLY